jgi:hypothetical protein
MSQRINHQDIVKKALDAKAVDFAALGKLIAELGPSLSLADEPWDVVCGTMRTFFHCYKIGTGGAIIDPLPPDLTGGYAARAQ